MTAPHYSDHGAGDELARLRAIVAAFAKREPVDPRVGGRGTPWCLYCPRVAERDVVEIRQRYALGVRIAEIARAFKLTHSAVDHIVKGRNWKHLLIDQGSANDDGDQLRVQGVR